MAIITTNNAGQLNIGNRPSVFNIVELIGHGNAPMLEMMERTQATAVVHSWIVDRIGDINVQYFNEISAPAVAGINTKQQTSNAVQIFKTSVAVSYDQSKSALYGNDNAEAHEKKKAAREHLIKQEGAFLGIGRANIFDAPEFRKDNTTPGKSAGMPYYLTLDEASFTDGRRGNVLAVDSNEDGTGTLAELTEDLLDQFASIPYENNAGMTDIFMGVNLKRRVNKLFERQLGNETHANRSFTTIELTTGPARLHLHPFMTDQYGLGNAIIGGDFSYAKWAVLEEVNEPLMTEESARKWQYYMSACGQITNARAFAMMIGCM